MTSFLISTLAPFILAGKQSCKTVLLPSFFITSCRRVSFHNNLGTLNYQHWRCAIAPVRHKSTPLWLCRFRDGCLLLFYFTRCVSHMMCASKREPLFFFYKGFLMSTCMFSETHLVKVTFWLVFLFLFFSIMQQHVFVVFLSSEQITERQQPKQMCL